MQDKDICQNCGAELNEENKYMDGMCMECKCGIDCDSRLDISSKDVAGNIIFNNDLSGLSISDSINVIKTNPYLLFGVLTIDHRTCEDVFSEIGSLIDKLSLEIQYNPENIDNYLEETSCLKDMYNKLSYLSECINNYKNNINKFIQDGQDSH